MFRQPSSARWCLILVFLIAVFAPMVQAQPSFDEFLKKTKPEFHLSLNAFPDRERVRVGDGFRLHVIATLDSGWHIYSLQEKSPSEPVATTIELHAERFLIEGEWQENQPKLARDDVLDKVVKTHVGTAEFHLRLKVPPHSQPGTYPLTGVLKFRSCNNKVCTLPREKRFRTRVIVEK